MGYYGNCWICLKYILSDIVRYGYVENIYNKICLKNRCHGSMSGVLIQVQTFWPLKSGQYGTNLLEKWHISFFIWTPISQNENTKMFSFLDMLLFIKHPHDGLGLVCIETLNTAFQYPVLGSILDSWAQILWFFAFFTVLTSGAHKMKR